ncbi:MAG: TRAP transporter large permease [Paracoccaceae bacterium]
MVTLLMLVISIGLFLIRVPVSIAMGIATVIGYLVLPMPINVMATRMVDGVDGFALLAVPFFILAGNVMNAGGITEKIFAFARACFGWIHGGLAQVNITASVIFAGMSGSALADLAGLGAVEMKAMKKAGYPGGFSAAVTLASCTIGPLIPPSIILVIYGLATNTSIGRLFLGGALAGLVVAACLMLYVYLYVLSVEQNGRNRTNLYSVKSGKPAKKALRHFLPRWLFLARWSWGSPHRPNLAQLQPVTPCLSGCTIRN